MTLSPIVTVAPVVCPVPCGIQMPPPVAKPAASFMPPVIVTRLIATCRSLAPSNAPMVMTGPPPLMIVAPEDMPTRSTLFKIVIPPANVPGPILIVSPSCAASTAAWIVEKQPSDPTQRSAAGAASADD
jgi:hypothetical protein